MIKKKINIQIIIGEIFKYAILPFESRFNRVLLIFIYIITFVIIYNLSWQLRFDFDIPDVYSGGLNKSTLWIIPLKILCLFLFRQFRCVLRFFGVRDLIMLFSALFTSSVLSLFIRTIVDDKLQFTPSRGIIFLDFVISLLAIALLRLLFRVGYEYIYSSNNMTDRNVERVAIIGAGDLGATLARELYSKNNVRIKPVFFLDDDSSKWNLRIHDIPVLGNPEMIGDVYIKENISRIIIALPANSTDRINEIVNYSNNFGLKCSIVPSILDLTSGLIKFSNLRNVQIQDLLGRDQVILETNKISDLHNAKIVMVTGAGGSIGSELCRQILNFKIKRLILVEQCEVQLFKIEQELFSMGYNKSIKSVIADILDEQNMKLIFKRYMPNIVYHAAAHKHVPLMEDQPTEAFKNNTIGTTVVAKLSNEFKVSQFVFISTDKAINPTNVMGASKRMAEIFLQSYSNSPDITTKYSAVRFGNVLGSSGSVVPIFEKQIDNGGPVKVTHPDVTRYFMTIPEAVGLVLQAASQSIGGEIFVLDMGKPVKIVDLARKLIELHGRRPDIDIHIEYIGLRPGEKLYEEINHVKEGLVKTNHQKIMRFISSDIVEYKVLNNQFSKIENSYVNLNKNQIKRTFQEIVPEYNPYLN